MPVIGAGGSVMSNCADVVRARCRDQLQRAWPRKPDPVQRATFLALCQAGLTLEAIGWQSGISKERVHQILSTIQCESQSR